MKRHDKLVFSIISCSKLLKKYVKDFGIKVHFHVLQSGYNDLVRSRSAGFFRSNSTGSKSSLFIPLSIFTALAVFPLQIQFIALALYYLVSSFGTVLHCLLAISLELPPTCSILYLGGGWDKLLHPTWGTQLPEYVWYAYH